MLSQMSLVLKFHRLIVVAITICLACEASQSGSGLSLSVIEGHGAINSITRNTAFEPVVEVRDAAGRPVEGASVAFTLPTVGPGATFPDGSKVLLTQTDGAGRATARGLRPNRATGQFEIHVRANYNGDSASATITQTNAAPAVVPSRSGKKWAIILGVLGGAVAAGAVAAGGGGASTPAGGPPAAAVPPAGSVTPGAPGFGPPR